MNNKEQKGQSLLELKQQRDKERRVEQDDNCPDSCDFCCICPDCPYPCCDCFND